MPRVIGFHYTLRDDTGEVLDSSAGGDPLFFLEGSGQIIPGLERQLLDLGVGDRRAIEVPAGEAYGDVDPALVARVKRSRFPRDAALDVGQQFTTDADGRGPVFTIVDTDAEHITVDANHPMAGRDLRFEVEIVAVRDATADEQAHGHAHGASGSDAH